MGLLKGFPRFVLVQFKDLATQVVESKSVDYDDTEPFDYEQEHVVLWAEASKQKKSAGKKFSAHLLLFHGNKLAPDVAHNSNELCLWSKTFLFNRFKVVFAEHRERSG